MRSIFTEYVIQLNTKADLESWHEAREALSKLLQREIRRRGLWNLSPAYLGVFGWSHWAQPGEGQSGPLDEILADCHEFIFVRRLRSLAVHARVSGSIDGIVVQAMRNFLHDTQKRHDPLGFRVFELLRAACRNLVEAGLLLHVEGPTGIGNGTVLSFVPDAADTASQTLEELVDRWHEGLLPDLVTASKRSQITRLEEKLKSLTKDGVQGFHFRDLAEPLKNGVRAGWAAALGQEGGETALEGGEDMLPSIVHLVPPDLDLVQRDSFEKLLIAVEEALEALELSPKMRRYLMILWEFLIAYSADSNPASGVDEGSGIKREKDRLPSNRKLSKLLNIPRESLPKLFSILGETIEEVMAPANSEKIPL